MCYEEEIKTVSEDVRVIHNELEKAYSWIFAAQEILRPENEEFDPDIKDMEHIETVLGFAMIDLKEALELCKIYKESKLPTVKRSEEDKKAISQALLKELQEKLEHLKGAHNYRETLYRKPLRDRD